MNREAYVKQLGRGFEKFSETNQGGESSVLRTYKFYDIWPTQVSEIALSYDNDGAIEDFTVTFAVQFFSIGENEESGSSDDSASLSVIQ